MIPESKIALDFWKTPTIDIRQGQCRSTDTLREKSPYSEFFSSVFSHIRRNTDRMRGNEYGLNAGKYSQYTLTVEEQVLVTVLKKSVQH